MLNVSNVGPINVSKVGPINVSKVGPINVSKVGPLNVSKILNVSKLKRSTKCVKRINAKRDKLSRSARCENVLRKMWK